MALDNLISVVIPQGTIDQINQLFEQIDTLIAPFVINLTPDERTEFGRIRLENAQLPVKTLMYMNQLPNVVPSYLDLTEFTNDQQSRVILENFIARASSLREKLDDTFILLGTDAYNACVLFYRALKTAAESNVPGATSAYEDLRQHFPGGRPPGSGGGDTPPNP